MMNGMTGFGSSSFFYNGIKYTIKLRSVNFKFLEFVISLPQEMTNFDIEAKIKGFLSKHLSRGRVTVQLLSEPEANNREISLNRQALKKYMATCEEIKAALCLRDNIRLQDVLGLPGIFYFQPIDNTSDSRFLALLSKSLQQAARHLVQLRRKEGGAIFKDLSMRIKKIKECLECVEQRAAQITKQKKQSSSQEEFAEFLKNYNVQEEITRFKFYTKTFVEKLSKGSSIGKMLDFIVQEMQREINTLNAKFRDKKAFYRCLLIKDELEKIKEQLQNVE